MKPITISVVPEGEPWAGSFRVEQEGRYHDGMGWDEMLGQIVSLTFASTAERIKNWGGPNGALYGMRTAEEWAEGRRQLEERRAARQSQPEGDLP